MIPAPGAHPFGDWASRPGRDCDHPSVSRHGNIQNLSGDELATERNFDVVMRGYHRREVDRYVSLLEGQVAALSTERQDAESQLRNLSAQLHRVQMELLELRRQPSTPDKVTFRHLGPRPERRCPR